MEDKFLHDNVFKFKYSGISQRYNRSVCNKRAMCVKQFEDAYNDTQKETYLIKPHIQQEKKLKLTNELLKLIRHEKKSILYIYSLLKFLTLNILKAISLICTKCRNSLE